MALIFDYFILKEVSLQHAILKLLLAGLACLPCLPAGRNRQQTRPGGIEPPIASSLRLL